MASIVVEWSVVPVGLSINWVNLLLVIICSILLFLDEKLQLESQST